MSREQDAKHWQPPSDEGWDNASRRMGWINDIVSYGEQYNASLLSSKDIGASIDLIAGRNNINRPNQSRSSLTINRGKRALREVVASIADVRAIDGYTSENPAYQSYLAMHTKVW